MTDKTPAAAQAKAQPAGTSAAAPANAGNAQGDGKNKGAADGGANDKGAAAAVAATDGKEGTDGGDGAAAGAPAKGDGAAAGGKTEPTAEEKAAAEAAKAVPAVPEKYELKLAKDSPIPAARLEEIVAEAKAAGKTAAQAQADAEREHNAVAADRQRELAALAVRQESWGKTILADPQFQGEEGARRAAYAERLVTAFGDDELKQVLDSTKFGNYPAFVRFCAKIGEAGGEDMIVGGSTGGEGEHHSKDVLFGDKGKR